MEAWDVRDPIGESEEVFRQVRDQIEQRVLELIERLRSRKPVGPRYCRHPDRPSQQRLTLGGGLLDNKSVPPIMRMWRNWQTR